MTRPRSLLLAAAAVAMTAGIATNANATLLPFSITPTGLTGVASPTGTISNLGTLNLNSNALITQNTTNQTESGWAQVTGLSGTNGLAVFGTGLGDSYNLYILFTATVPLTSWSPGTAPITDFSYQLIADIGASATFNPGSPSGIAPSVICRTATLRWCLPSVGLRTIQTR